jgi:hypothetical protein
MLQEDGYFPYCSTALLIEGIAAPRSSGVMTGRKETLAFNAKNQGSATATRPSRSIQICLCLHPRCSGDCDFTRGTMKAPELIADPVESSKQAGLRYVTDAKPGITRKPFRKKFRYFHSDGTPVKDATILARIQSLAIPPA